MAQPGTADAARRLTPVVRLAPAKLNLTLAILGRRRDGFHDLHSVMVPLELADVLSFARAPAGTDTLHVEGHDPGPPADNLVLRAIAEARRAVGAGWVDLGGPAGPAAGPTLSDALGGPVIADDTSAKLPGRGTFDTLTGNALQR